MWGGMRRLGARSSGVVGAVREICAIIGEILNQVCLGKAVNFAKLTAFLMSTIVALL